MRGVADYASSNISPTLKVFFISKKRVDVSKKDGNFFLQLCSHECGTTMGTSKESIFNMERVLVMNQDLKAFQSAKTMVMEVANALISIKCCSSSSNGSSCSISKVVLIMLLYLSAWLFSRCSLSAR